MKKFIGPCFAILLALMPFAANAQSIRPSDGTAVIRQCEHGEMRGGCIRESDGSYYKQEESPVGRREIAESNEQNARDANRRGERQRQTGPGPQRPHRPQ